MKATYNVPWPSATKLMSKELEEFYKFYDDPDKQTACFEFDDPLSADKCSSKISSARYRRGLDVEVKRIECKVFVRKVAAK